eukprot:TRINITY_DN18180_c0_g1_i1.p1 TRINITY_DN18180_c0_g1~~TRINITY_DN18180_c0_g1_i1.p1  ORF type:complete len:326 (-),score=-9.36 TRINITY_DN18180_c0_g1_i1:11-988(-)
MKRAKTSQMIIGTHSGSFHCDEALACYMLSRHTEQFRDARIVRSRAEDVWATCDILVDVGGVFNHEERKYDHHQRGFEATLSDAHSIKLSSAGLVYRFYGHEVIRSVTGLQEDADVQSVWLRVYDELIASVDAVDNGVSRYENAGEARYAVNTDLGSRVKALNAPWNQEVSDEQVDAAFQEAMKLTGGELERIARYQANAWLPARKLVREMLDERPHPQVGVFQQFVPWIDHVFDMEAADAEPLLYVLFPDQGGMWRVRCVPVAPGSFECRKALPEPWRGLRGEELQATIGEGVDDGVRFVHHAGFIAGHATKQGAMQMALKAMQ